VGWAGRLPPGATTYTRPAVIRWDFVDKIRSVGAHHVPDALLEELMSWGTTVRDAIMATPSDMIGQTLSLCSEHGTPQVSKLALVLSQLVKILRREKSRRGTASATAAAPDSSTSSRQPWWGRLGRVMSFGT